MYDILILLFIIDETIYMHLYEVVYIISYAVYIIMHTTFLLIYIFLSITYMYTTCVIHRT